MGAVEVKKIRFVNAWRLSVVFAVVCFGVQAAAQNTDPNDGEGLTISKQFFAAREPEGFGEAAYFLCSFLGNPS